MIIEPSSSSWMTRLAFVASASLAALALRFSWQQPLLGALGLALLLSVVLARWRSRRRIHRLLRSGDVESVLQRWSSSFERIPHPETMGPLMAATAFAAYGWIGRARELLSGAERGLAWEAALEHRLFLESLLLTFEGRGDEALVRASALSQLPLPTAAPFMSERIQVLRDAVAALARAFSHRGQAGDRQLLVNAGSQSPLVHWAMRYGAAILAVDEGQLDDARTLLADAPEWPSESCFSLFHRDIEGELERRLREPSEPSPVDGEASHTPAAGQRLDEEDGA